ncbi:PD-(D/E)XK nuclease family protein [Natrialbaceae archaeon A-CW1-1]
MNRSVVETEIDEFAAAFESLPDVTEPPRTTLHVLRERTGEKYWNRLLRYFLDPSAPHGFGSDLLRGFIELIEAESDATGLADTTLEDVRIASEVSSDAGRPDLLVTLDEEWFICIEVKVTASETGTQTSEYAASTQLGDLTVNEYPADGQQYVYLATRRHAAPSSDQFTHLFWEDVQRVLGDVLQNSHGRYPSRSTAQLSEFRDTIREETMTETPYDTQQSKHVELYLEHADAIDSVHTAFENMVDQQIDEWATRFVDQHHPPSWDTTWNAAPGKWGKIYWNNWRRNEHGDPVENWSDAAYRLEFRHHIRKHRSWRDGTVTFQTTIPSNSDDEFKTRCHTEFTTHSSDIHSVCDQLDIQVKGNKRVLTEKTYSFNPQDGPDAYYTTLKDAFEEHQPLISPLTTIYENAYTSLLD